MVPLLLKLVLTPAVMIAATLAGRRYGSAVSGWLIGLPLMSGPLVFVLALEHGRPFAAHTATGSLSGTIAEAAFCVGWLAGSRRGVAGGLVAASAGFAIAAVTVAALPLAALVPLTVAALLGALRLLPTFAPQRSSAVHVGRWDMSARAIIATVVIVVLSALATTIGARLTGLLAVYPLYSAVLAAFAQRRDGRDAALALLRGLLFGLFAFVAFYTSLALLLSSTWGAFAVAVVAALITQTASLRSLRLRAPRFAPDRLTADSPS